MAVPLHATFSPVAVLSSGLIARYNAYGFLVPDGVAAVTRFVVTEGWAPPEPVTTGWTTCCPSVSTSWTDTYAQPTTTWTLIV